MRLLNEAGGTLNLENCRLVAEAIDYLSNVIRHSSVELAERMADAVAKLESCTTQKKLRCFPSLCNVPKRYVPSFARLAAPCNRTLRKYQSKTFGILHEKQSAVVGSLEATSIGPPVLAVLRAKERYTLNADPYNKQIRCVFLRKQEKEGSCTVGNWSRTLNNKEQELSTTHSRCLAVI